MLSVYVLMMFIVIDDSLISLLIFFLRLLHIIYKYIGPEMPSIQSQSIYYSKFSGGMPQTPLALACCVC